NGVGSAIEVGLGVFVLRLRFALRNGVPGKRVRGGAKRIGELHGPRERLSSRDRERFRRFPSPCVRLGTLHQRARVVDDGGGTLEFTRRGAHGVRVTKSVHHSRHLSCTTGPSPSRSLSTSPSMLTTSTTHRGATRTRSPGASVRSEAPRRRTVFPDALIPSVKPHTWVWVPEVALTFTPTKPSTITTTMATPVVRPPTITAPSLPFDLIRWVPLPR